MPTFGCAYWGRDASVADRDLASLPALGFSWVVIPVSTERMRYDRAGAAASPLWWPAAKIAGRELSKHVGDIHTRPRPGLEGVEVHMPVGAG